MPLRPRAHLIDTNVILRYLIGDVPAHAAGAAALMERLELRRSLTVYSVDEKHFRRLGVAWEAPAR